MSKVAILVPCYNEELTIAKVVEDCKKYVPDAEVYVCDNNSTDKTMEIAKKAMKIAGDMCVYTNHNLTIEEV